MAEIWTLKRILDWSSDYLSQKGMEHARLESEILLCHVLKLRRLDLYLQFERPLSRDELADYKAVIKRRVNFEPSAYIVGQREFWSRQFFVSPDVLIPRPDTEVLIELILQKFKKHPITQKSIKGFELGIGSGAISVTLLSEFPEVKMAALEISSAAIQIAERNAKYHGVDTRLSIQSGDFFSDDMLSQIPDASLDFVVSNPPYISEDEYQQLSPTVKDFEPKLALVSGSTGLEFYLRLAQFSKRTLVPSGFLAVEIGENLGQSVKSIFEDAGLQNVTLHRDYAHHDRVVMGEKAHG